MSIGVSRELGVVGIFIQHLAGLVVVSIELQQLEVKSVISLSDASNQTLTTNFGLPQSHPIAQSVPKSAAY